MQQFDELIDSYIENQVGIAMDFMDPMLVSELAANLQSLYESNDMRPAGTGNETVVHHDQKFRSDKIHWLDPLQPNPHEATFFSLIDQFVSHLNSTCYTGISNYEFHYALYETGSFYKKHLDQFRNDDSRAFSMIIYLNPAWIAGDGGELCISHPSGQQQIPPTGGKAVFFKSDEMPHEVLLSNKPRMSITGWLKK